MSIVHEDEQCQIVQLHQEFNEITLQIITTYMRVMQVNGEVSDVALNRAYMGGQGDWFYLSPEQADAFCEAWKTFKSRHEGERAKQIA